jgi:hypothetical protein
LCDAICVCLNIQSQPLSLFLLEFYFVLLLRARDALRVCLPETLTDQSFGEVIRSEEAVQRWLAHLLKNLSDKGTASTTPAAPTATPTTSATPASKTGAPQNPFSAQGAWQNTPSTNGNTAT